MRDHSSPPKVLPRSSKDPFRGATVRDLRLKPITTIPVSAPLSTAIETMREKGFDQLPVLSSLSKGGQEKLMGLITLGNCLSWIGQGRADTNSKVEEVMFSFRKMEPLPKEAMDDLILDDNENNTTDDNSSGQIGKKTRRRKQFVEIELSTPLKALNRFFEWNSAAVVTERAPAAGGMKPVAVVTKVDLLTWLVKRDKAGL